MMYVMASGKNSFVRITSVVIKIFFKNTFLDQFFFLFSNCFLLSPLQVVYAVGSWH